MFEYEAMKWLYDINMIPQVNAFLNILIITTLVIGGKSVLKQLKALNTKVDTELGRLEHIEVGLDDHKAQDDERHNILHERLITLERSKDQ